MSKSFRAVYRDDQGRTYSCPVEIHDGKWMLFTTSGLAPITHSLDNEEYGIVVFDSYREEDSRLHLSPLPGESSFNALKRAYAEKVVAQQRRDRSQARAEIQNTNLPDPQKVQAAQELNAQILRERRPQRGPAIIKGD